MEIVLSTTDSQSIAKEDKWEQYIIDIWLSTNSNL